MTIQDASQIAAEALSFIAAYDRSNSYEMELPGFSGHLSGGTDVPLRTRWD